MLSCSETLILTDRRLRVGFGFGCNAVGQDNAPPFFWSGRARGSRGLAPPVVGIGVGWGDGRSRRKCQTFDVLQGVAGVLRMVQWYDRN